MTKRTEAELFRQLCREHNCKCTAQRFAVYLHVCGNTTHPTVDQVWEKVRQEMPGITRESVFRILTELAEWGVITRLDKIVNARFDGIPGNHGHFICRKCGAIADFPLPETLPVLPAGTGFRMEHVELRIGGLCAACAEKKKQNSPEREKEQQQKG